VSLKAFHIFFIVVSALMAFGVAAWALLSYTASGSFGYLAAAIGSVIAGAGLIFYGVKFLKKLKNVSFV
jgi:hypothetical protein